MRTSVALQLLGPVSLFGVMAMAEGAAYALNCAPSSEWLWYFNLKCVCVVPTEPLCIGRGFGRQCANSGRRGAIAHSRRSRGRLQADIVVGDVKQSHARLRRVCSLKLGPGEGAAPGLTVGSLCGIDEFGGDPPRRLGVALPAFVRRVTRDLSPEDNNTHGMTGHLASVVVDLAPYLRNLILGRADRLPQLQDPQRGGRGPCRIVFPVRGRLGAMGVRSLERGLCSPHAGGHDLHLRRE